MENKFQTMVGYKAPKKKMRLLPYGCDALVNFAVVALCLIGLLTIASASMKATADLRTKELMIVIFKQLAFVTIGYIGMYYVSKKFTLDFLRSPALPFCAIGMIVLLLFPLAFTAAGGAKAWIRLPGNVSIQPSEFAKIMTILVMAAYCGDIKKKFPTNWDMMKRPVMIVLSYMFIVLVLQGDFGSMFVIALIAYVCFIIPNNPQMRGMQKLGHGLVIFGISIGAYLLSPLGSDKIPHLPLDHFQIARFESCVQPFADMFGDSMNLSMSLIALARGGWSGVGYSNSISKYANFPASNTDFIFAIFVEENGFIGFAVIFALYMIIIFRLMNYARYINSEKAKIILVGTAMYMAIHCFFNIGGVIGYIPLTGIPLLLISSGGTSSVSIMLCIGLSQAVIRQYHLGEIA